MKNILIIPSFIPYPLISGGSQAIINGIAILKDIANVYLLIDTTESKWKRGEGREIEDVLPFVKVVPFILPESRHTSRWYWRVICNKIREVLPRRENKEKEYSRHQSSIGGVPEIKDGKVEFILNSIKDLHIDIVQVEAIGNLRIVESLPEGLLKIFVHHELRFVRDELIVKAQGELSQQNQEILLNNKQEEIRLLNKYDHIITLSSIDTQKLMDAGVTTRITSSFAIVRSDDEPHSKQPVKKVISFVGYELHYPNYEGVMWFLENVWRKLLDRDPDYQFQIIGKWSDETAAYLSKTYNGVSCVGFVDNLSEAIMGTTMIVPLNIGSGIRMKILEAARIGVPIVSTTVGAEGLPLVDGVHAFITDNIDEFIEGILKLQNEELRNKFIANTQKVIEEKYTYDALLRSRQHLYV